MVKIFYISIFLIFILFSCKKDPKITGETIVPTNLVASNYAKLAVGNYWIYQRFKIDSSGIATPLNNYDSCYVISKTVFADITYFEVYSPNTYGSPYIYLRDSAGWISTLGLRTVFSPTDFCRIFHTGYAMANSTDTIAKGVNKMANKDSIVVTPAGSFITSNSQWIHYMYPTWQQYGEIRRTNTCYAENIGIVVETLKIIFTIPDTYERRLIRYHLN